MQVALKVLACFFLNYLHHGIGINPLP